MGLESGEFLIKSSVISPTVGLASDGHALVAWDDDAFIYGQFLGNDGQLIHSELFVDPAASTWNHSPEIDMLADGRFVVAYDGRTVVAHWM